MSTPALPTQEEMELIRDYVILPFLLDLVQKNRTQMESQPGTLQSLYLKAGDALLDLIHNDLAKVRKQMRERKIKVIEEERSSQSIRFRFICRGYEDDFALMRMVLKSEMSTRLPQYIAAVFRK